MAIIPFDAIQEIINEGNHPMDSGETVDKYIERLVRAIDTEKLKDLQQKGFKLYRGVHGASQYLYTPAGSIVIEKVSGPFNHNLNMYICIVILPTKLWSIIRIIDVCMNIPQTS